MFLNHPLTVWVYIPWCISTVMLWTQDSQEALLKVPWDKRTFWGPLLRWSEGRKLKRKCSALLTTNRWQPIGRFTTHFGLHSPIKVHYKPDLCNILRQILVWTPRPYAWGITLEHLYWIWMNYNNLHQFEISAEVK